MNLIRSLICRLLICIGLFCISGLAHTAEFSAKVIAVSDGDTLLVKRDGHPVKLRLAEIDAPEQAQPYGIASQKSLAEMVMGKQVNVVSRAVDDYGRTVATVNIGDLNVNYEQVRRGMAWEYSRFHSNRELVALQREAQLAKRGLWAGVEIIEPAQWRKQHPRTPAAHLPAEARREASLLDPACARNRCSQMASCEEARAYQTRCGIKTMDGDGDGIPCEQLCAAQQKIKN